MKIFINDGGRRLVSESGYGRVSKNVSDWLIKLGENVVFADQDPGGYKDASFCLFICPPYSATHPYPNKKNVIITMHEQATLPPAKEDWPNILNGLDLIITPSSWNKKIFQNLGVNTPIEVAPLGSEPTVFYPLKDKFRMVSVFSGLGSGSSRENWADTISAYYKAFHNKEDVELIFKTWQWKEKNWEGIHQKIKKETKLHPAQFPKLTIISNELSNDELRELYQKSSVAIKNANRESWGLGANEAILCGLQMIASRVPPLDVFMPEGTHWVDLGDVDQLAFYMKLEYELFQEKIRKTRQFTWERTARRVQQILKAYDKTN